MKQAADAIESRRFSANISNAGLFFRRWLANPLQMGSVVPSGPALCGKIVAQTHYTDDEVVVELGAGTGVVSQALLQGGLPADRLYVVEIVGDMARHLRAELPGAHVIEGDARRLPTLIPPALHGRVGTVVVGIPLVMLPFGEQKRFIDAIEAIAPKRGFILYTYWVTSPLPFRKHGLAAKREAWTLSNIPPASVWRYTPSV